MYLLATWAKHHKLWARIIITISHVLGFAMAAFFGLQLFIEDIQLTHIFLYTLASLFTIIATFSLNKKTNSKNLWRLFYGERLMHSSLTLLGFCLFLFLVNNQLFKWMPNVQSAYKMELTTFTNSGNISGSTAPLSKKEFRKQ